MHPHRIHLAGCAILALASLGAAADAQHQNDVVILDNGDRISGEIKGMSQGQLVLDTDHLGTLNIPWVHIRQITGDETFEVELEDGDMHVGSIEPSEHTGMISVVGQNQTIDLHKVQVVRMVPIKKSFWKRLDGGVNLGYSFTKSSEVSQFSLSADASARTQRHMTNLTLNSIFTVQQVAETSSRLELTATRTRFLPHNWLVEGAAGIIHNEELGVNARVLLGGGGGRFLRRTDRNWVKFVGGLNVIREWPTGVARPDTNLEANLSLDYILFRYSVNSNYFRTGLVIYPGLSQWGRVRAEWTLRLQQTLVGNFGWSLNGYASFDSDPLDSTAATDDWGVVTALGWTF